ncbi:hypothetical protein FG386_001708 [Cryptosporidium ryanae]|uniref:uncharacterized protein n=1 Tax=Cryptosporidium ryanae TaxID=515981 RepID=UPI00351A8CB8|nr:hypothetical protein FG386_001708 [Cryptosporidium ryanae]
MTKEVILRFEDGRKDSESLIERHRPGNVSPWSIPQIMGIPPSPRAAHTCDHLSGRLFLFGGWNGREALNDFYVLYINQTLKWQKLIPSKERPSRRNNHASAVYGGNSLLIHGGHNGKRWLKDMYEFKTLTKAELEGNGYEKYETCCELNEKLIGTWTKLEVNGSNRKRPSSRACHTISKIENKIYLFGGYDGTRCYNDLWVYDMDNKIWSEIEITERIPKPRNGHSSITCNKGVLIFGGHTGKEYLSDVVFYVPEQSKFIYPDIHGTAPSSRKGHSMTLVDDSTVVMFGGYDGKNRLNDLYILDVSELPFNVMWEKRTEINDNNVSIPTSRQRSTITSVNSGKCFIFGGYDGHSWKSDSFILDTRLFFDSKHVKNLSLPMIYNLSNLVDNPEFSDIVFVLENNERLYAHKCILSTQSEYFNSMFKIGMSESLGKEVVLTHIPKREFKSIINFLYTSFIEETDIHVLCNIMILADSYNINSLFNMCINNIKQMVSIDNVCDVIRISHTLSINELLIYCIKFASNNLDSIINDESFIKLKSEHPKLAMKISDEIVLQAKCKQLN